jgi:pimeloyl-ACP methyl ester carboxylesterase
MDQRSYRNAETALWHHYGLEPRERFVTLPRFGASMRVHELGDGPPLLFVHGGPTSGVGVAALLPYLDGFRSIVIDRPGSGLSPDLAWTRDLLGDFMSFFVADALDALGLERAHVAGSSWGGTIALRAAAATPERVERLILHGGPSAIEGQRMPGLEKLLLMPGVARLMARLTPGRRMQRSAIKANGHADAVADGRIPDAYWAWYDCLMQETDTYPNEMRALALLGNWSMQYGPEVEVRLTDLRRISASTLIIWGGRDPYGTREAADHIAGAMPRAEVLYLAEAGHLPWLDDPACVGEATVEFLRDQRALAAAA